MAGPDRRCVIEDFDILIVLQNIKERFLGLQETVIFYWKTWVSPKF
jgi:hypothetical protein